MTDTPLTINADRLHADLNALAEIGRVEGGGIRRMAFTEADMDGRRWLMSSLDQAGLQATMDGAGNVSGRWSDYGAEPTVMVGSHLDTVPNGGPLDGALGVLIGLECLRRIKEEGLADSLNPVELISFSDEEGRFGGGFLGSRAICGYLVPQAIKDAADFDGVSLVEAMQAVGLDPMEALHARRAPGSIRAYLELHIEQGPVLDSLGTSTGIVQNITGLWRWHVSLIGRPDHAGTTPMNLRSDALGGLAEFANEIPRVLEENDGDQSVATIGFVQLEPGTANTVPGRVDFSLDVRDVDRKVLDGLGAAFRRALSAIARRRDLMFEFRELSNVDPVACSEEVITAIGRAAGLVKQRPHRMNSGAGHDAQVVASMAPVGMVFVPSVEGRSHSPAEWTHFDDIVDGANLMLNTVLELARRE